MTDPKDEARARADEEWSRILGQTTAFLGRVQALVTEEVARRPAPAKAADPPTAEELEDIVAAFPRTLGELLVAYEISARALARARAAYGEISAPRLRVLAFSRRAPEIIAEIPLVLPGRGEEAVALPKRAGFVLAAIGVSDPEGAFRPIAHAEPVPLAPAALYPRGNIPSLWIEPGAKEPPAAALDRPAEVPALDEEPQKTPGSSY
jgi:hypothetical protein